MIKRIGITVVASCASLAGGFVTVHAATQSQNQTVQSGQYQSVTTTSAAPVDASQSSSVSSTQSATLPTATSQTPVSSSGQNQANGQQTSDSTTNKGVTDVTQSQGIGINDGQNQAIATSQNVPVSVPTRTVFENVSTPPNPKTVVGYAIFDLAGNRLSDTFGTMSNATSHFDDFQPNVPVVLLLKAVNADGDAIVNTVSTRVYLHSTNQNSNTSILGRKFRSIYICKGSNGVPFVYTSVGQTAGFDVIDASPLQQNSSLAPNLTTSNAVGPGVYQSSWSNGWSWSTTSSNQPGKSQATTTGSFAGYAVFDMQGQRVSDTYASVSNATAHLDNFQPNAPVILLVKAVDASGSPMQNPRDAYVHLASNNTQGSFQILGRTITGVEMPAGSVEVPFVYVNQGSASSFDVIDATVDNTPTQSIPNTNVVRRVAVQVPIANFTPTPGQTTQTATVTANQNETVAATTPVTAVQSQTTGDTAVQSQSMSGTSADTQTQNVGSQTQQAQALQTAAAATINQQQNTTSTTTEVQASTLVSNGPGTTTTLDLSQVQSVQPPTTPATTDAPTATTPAVPSVNAAQAQQATFAVAPTTNLYVTQSVNQSESDTLISEEIKVDLNSNSNSTSTPGNLNVYVNGTFYQTYNCDGEVTISEAQSVTPANESPITLPPTPDTTPTDTTSADTTPTDTTPTDTTPTDTTTPETVSQSATLTMQQNGQTVEVTLP